MVDELIKFSVITVAYNAASTIADTLASVVAQDYSAFEHIIVDGASTDHTRDVVLAEQHDRLRFVSEPDDGCYDAMNKGLALATGDVVVFLNADDFLARPDALSLVARAFASHETDCVIGHTAIVDQSDVRRVRRSYRSVGFRPWMLRFGHMPPHPSFYARRESLVAIGGFDTSFRVSGDFDQMVRLMLGRNIRYVSIPETLAGFRVGGLSTRDWTARATIDREIGRSLRQNGLPSFRALRWLRYPFKALQLVRRPHDYPNHLNKLDIRSRPR